jgi:hypothetical protein
MRGRHIKVAVAIASTLAVLGTAQTSGATQSSSTTRCVAVGPSLLSRINAGMKGRYRVRSAWAIRSSDFTKVWYVGGVIRPGGLVGVWATNVPPRSAGYGLIIAADKDTLRYSVLGAATQSGSAAAAVRDKGNDDYLDALTHCKP